MRTSSRMQAVCIGAQTKRSQQKRLDLPMSVWQQKLTVDAIVSSNRRTVGQEWQTGEHEEEIKVEMINRPRRLRTSANLRKMVGETRWDKSSDLSDVYCRWNKY